MYLYMYVSPAFTLAVDNLTDRGGHDLGAPGEVEGDTLLLFEAGECLTAGEKAQIAVL